MIVINKDFENNITAVTLREFQTEESECFLFVFKNVFTGEIIRANLQDVSTAKKRSNIFCIPGNLFTLTGFYNYSVYQNPDSKETEDGLKCMERGRAKIVSNPILTKVFTFDVITRKVYG